MYKLGYVDQINTQRGMGWTYHFISCRGLEIHALTGKNLNSTQRVAYYARESPEPGDGGSTVANAPNMKRPAIPWSINKL